MKKNFKLIKNTEGQSLVEFALVLPILLILILGMIEFGWILNGKITLTSAAREGARTAIIYESEDDALEVVKEAINKSAESSSLIIEPADIDMVFENRNYGGHIYKTAVVTVDAKIEPIVGLFFSDAVDLSAKAEMKVE